MSNVPPRQPGQTATGPAGRTAADIGDPSLPARWRIGRLLGTGGQAAVWLALDTELGEQVAIKILRADLPEEARERLKREVSLGRNLQHQNLVRVYELLDLRDRLAIVMEWLEGGSLADRLATDELAITDVVRWADQALAALACLHARDVVHRDVKPSNLLLDAQGHLKLADLGLARRLDDPRDLTRTATTVGTPTFMSPEQLRGQRATPASDLYSLGVTLFILLTRRAPYTADSEYEVARMHLQEATPDPRRLRPDCPTWLARFVLRLMEKRPGDRYRSAAAALEALHRERALVSPRLRRRVLWSAAVVVAACLFVAGGARVLRARTAAARVARVEAVDNAVRGLDAGGREVWRVELASRVEQVDRADLDGDGVPELIAATRPVSAVRGTAVKSEVLAVTRSGRIVTHVSPEDIVSTWDYEFPKLLAPVVQVGDLDGRAPPELIVRCNQRQFFPSALLVYWPSLDTWQTVVVHSGWLRQVFAVPSASHGSLLVAGVNNRLGMLPVVGELRVVPPGSRSGTEQETMPSSPEEGISVRPGTNWLWYTPLPEQLDTETVTLTADGAVEMRTAGGVTARVDRLGNPDPGPNAGRDLRRERCAFLAAAARSFLPRAQLPAPGDVIDAIARIRTSSEPLMRETPYQAILGIDGARALARAGDDHAGIRLLEDTLAVAPYDEVSYRLAHLLAPRGRLDEAVALLQRLIASGHTPHAGYDAVHLLIRLAIERHDEALMHSAITRFRFWRNNSEDLTDPGGVSLALAARAHVWWDEPTAADGSAVSWSYAPGGAAMAALARWRLGHASENDLAVVSKAITDNPEARWDGELALAAVELSLGRAGDAVRRTGAAIAALEPTARDDFFDRQLLDLARGLFVRALADSGQSAEALRQAEHIRHTLRNGLLPAILVDEAVARVRHDTPSR